MSNARSYSNTSHLLSFATLSSLQIIDDNACILKQQKEKKENIPALYGLIFSQIKNNPTKALQTLSNLELSHEELRHLLSFTNHQKRSLLNMACFEGEKEILFEA